MGSWDKTGQYHPEFGERMRHRPSGDVCRFRHEGYVQAKRVLVGVVENGNTTLIGPIADWEMLDLPPDPYDRAGR